MAGRLGWTARLGTCKVSSSMKARDSRLLSLTRAGGPPTECTLPTIRAIPTHLRMASPLFLTAQDSSFSPSRPHIDGERVLRNAGIALGAWLGMEGIKRYHALFGWFCWTLKTEGAGNTGVGCDAQYIHGVGRNVVAFDRVMISRCPGFLDSGSDLRPDQRRFVHAFLESKKSNDFPVAWDLNCLAGISGMERSYLLRPAKAHHGLSLCQRNLPGMLVQHLKWRSV